MSLRLSSTASNEEIIQFIDQWVSLLEEEKYAEALAIVETEDFWTPELLKSIITEYGGAPDDRVTLRNNGTIMDGLGNVNSFHQRKEVTWYNKEGEEDRGWVDENRGDVWYDLNINGLGSDLTATFDVEKQAGQLRIILDDVHVM